MSENLANAVSFSERESFADHLYASWLEQPANERVLPAAWFRDTPDATPQTIADDFAAYDGFPNVVLDSTPNEVDRTPSKTYRPSIHERLSTRAQILSERYSLTGRRAVAAAVAGLLVASVAIDRGAYGVRRIFGGGAAVAAQQGNQLMPLPHLDLEPPETSTLPIIPVDAEPQVPSIDLHQQAQALLEAQALEQQATAKELTVEEKLGRLCGSSTITSSFNPKRVHPIYGDVRPHTGADLVCPEGAEIRPAGGGTVIAAKWMSGYGYTIDILHDDLRNGLPVLTKYAHLSAMLVSPGERVDAGSVIGAVGCTGDCTGSHLHFELKIGNEAVDPEQNL